MRRSCRRRWAREGRSARPGPMRPYPSAFPPARPRSRRTPCGGSCSGWRARQCPDADKPVSLDVAGVPRAQALRKLADAAGWSLVVHGPPGEAIDMHVRAQPAFKVLELLLDDGDYVAKRDGTLVSVEREG